MFLPYVEAVTKTGARVVFPLLHIFVDFRCNANATPLPINLVEVARMQPWGILREPLRLTAAQEQNARTLAAKAIRDARA